MSDIKNQPLQKLRNGAVNASLWEQTTKDNNKAFVTVSISKTYKTPKGFKEGRSFSAKDLENLKDILPKVQEEVDKWQDYYRAIGRAPDAPQPEKTAKAPENNMVAKRDAVMKQAQEARQSTPSQSQEYTQHYAPNQGEPDR